MKNQEKIVAPTKDKKISTAHTGGENKIIEDQEKIVSEKNEEHKVSLDHACVLFNIVD